MATPSAAAAHRTDSHCSSACLQIKQRTLPKSLSCGKTFRSQTALTKIDDVHHWLAELGKELAERVGEDRWASGLCSGSAQ